MSGGCAHGAQLLANITDRFAAARGCKRLALAFSDRQPLRIGRPRNLSILSILKNDL